jgi:hypothetical protein
MEGLGSNPRKTIMGSDELLWGPFSPMMIFRWQPCYLHKKRPAILGYVGYDKRVVTKPHHRATNKEAGYEKV